MQRKVQSLPQWKGAAAMQESQSLVLIVSNLRMHVRIMIYAAALDPRREDLMQMISILRAKHYSAAAAPRGKHYWAAATSPGCHSIGTWPG